MLCNAIACFCPVIFSSGKNLEGTNLFAIPGHSMFN